jgi:hypothetical protein
VAISTSNSYCLELHDDGGLAVGGVAVGGVGVYYKDIKVSMDLYLCRTRRKFSTARLTGGVGVGGVGVGGVGVYFKRYTMLEWNFICAKQASF